MKNNFKEKYENSIEILNIIKSNVCSDNWTYRHDYNMKFIKEIDIPKNEVGIFQSYKYGEFNLFVFANNNKLEITQIVPFGRKPLTDIEYNRIHDAFVKECIDRAVDILQ